MRIERTNVIVVAVVVLAALGACSGSDEAATAADAGSIRIAGFLFKPERLSVDAGTTVTWANADDIEHTITAGTPEATTGLFDSGGRSKGETFTHMFVEPGTFAYFCNNHKSMRGEVSVT